MDHTLGLSVVCPHCLCDGFNTANVRVRTLENVFKLRKLIKAIKIEKGQGMDSKDLGICLSCSLLLLLWVLRLAG